MTQQYFEKNPSSPSRPRKVGVRFAGASLSFTTDAGVFSRDGLDAGTELLLGALPRLSRGQRGLDLGCGWGPVGTLWALRCPEAEFVLTDVNERAVALARENAAANGAANAAVVAGDALQAVEGLFDAVALNPPIRTGKETVYRLFRAAMAGLKPGGALHIVIRVKQGAASAQKMLREEYGNCETVARGGGYHVLRCERGN